MENIHPEWYDFVLRLLYRLSADARGWHAQAQEGRVWSCVCWGRRRATELCVHPRTPVQKCAGTGKPDDATLPDEMQPVFYKSNIQGKTTSCALDYSILLIV